MVAEIRRQEPDISARKIAARLGVGKDTILRDIDELDTQPRHNEPEQTADAPDDTPACDTLVLVLDEPLRQALAVLRATAGGPDTPAQNEKAARAAIRSVADTILEQQQKGGRP